MFQTRAWVVAKPHPLQLPPPHGPSNGSGGLELEVYGLFYVCAHVCVFLRFYLACQFCTCCEKVQEWRKRMLDSLLFSYIPFAAVHSYAFSQNRSLAPKAVKAKRYIFSLGLPSNSLHISHSMNIILFGFPTSFAKILDESRKLGPEVLSMLS